MPFGELYCLHDRMHAAGLTTTIVLKSNHPHPPGHVFGRKRVDSIHVALAGAGGALQNPAGDSGDGGEKRYAALHDFCMGIPYSMVLIISGLIGFLTK